MDYAKQQQLSACGTCGYPERDHQAPAGEADSLLVLAALGGACDHFTVSREAMNYQLHLARADGKRRRGRGRVCGRVCGRCGLCGHRRESCPL